MALNPESDYVHRLAARNEAERDAKHCEPRLFADTFAFDGALQRIMAQPDVFRNGEKFPLRITHLIMAAQFAAEDEQTPVGGDERIVQRYGLRIRAHDTYYMNALSTPLPLWANKPVTASDVITRAQACWRFDRSFILGNRDTIEIQVALLVAPETGTERVAVAFDGVGLYSRQPKRLTGYLDINDEVTHTLDADDFRNDGTEPMEIHTATIHHTPDTAQSNPVGNIRNVRTRMRVNGNGTNQWWNWMAVSSPTQLVPANLLGLATGRAIVHRLPGDGWIWYPNEGVTPEMESFDTTRTDTILLAMAGYVMVL
jgi:hypothetical protein